MTTQTTDILSSTSGLGSATFNTATSSQQMNNNNNNIQSVITATTTTATGSDVEKKFPNNLENISENYMCDISMMKIADTNHTSSKMACPKINNHQYTQEESFDSATDSTEDSLSQQLQNDINDNERDNSIDEDNDDDEYGLAPLYLNEVEVDRLDEEQTITELVQEANHTGELTETAQNNSMRVAFGIILRLVLPLANGVVRGFKGIRDVQFLRVLRNIASSRQALTNLIAFAANTISMNLSSVQVSHRLEPILKLLKIRKSGDGLESLPDTGSAPGTPLSTPSTPTLNMPLYSPFIREPKGTLPHFSPNKRKVSVAEQAAPKCCTLNVLAEPPPDQPIRADIVFIHGLHGSQVNTWKQGLWENERQPVEFQRPPKPPVRPPKRHRHSRSTIIRPPHKHKRARFIQAEHFADSTERDTDNADENCGNEFSYVCGEAKDIHICDGVEYSFPTFRLRMNDNGRQLQAELESMLDDNDNNDDNATAVPKTRKKGNTTQKPSADDPNYSKCWPGDWLPLDCPGVRVMAVNYTTDQYLWRPLWKKKESRTNLVQRSREMAELLIQHRVGYGHPIIWVGHSKGGLFVKQIIVDAWESGKPAMAPFWRSSRGVFFYSVPHRGSHLASIKAPLLTRSIELIDIEKGSKYLLDLHRRFVGLYHLGHLKIEVFSFVETALTLMSVLYLRIVGVDSADPGIGDVCGIRLDHREICKPRSRECILYKELVKMINKVC